MKEIRWHGRGGQGAFTACKILGGAAVISGRYALAFPSFGPERRGAPVMAFTKIDDSIIVDRSMIKKSDYIIYLDETLYVENVKEDLKQQGKILLNTSKPDLYQLDDQVIAIDANRIAMKILHIPVHNTAMLGVLAAVDDSFQKEDIKDAIGDYLSEKAAERNRLLIDRIYELLHSGSRNGGKYDYSKT